MPGDLEDKSTNWTLLLSEGAKFQTVNAVVDVVTEVVEIREMAMHV